MTDTIDFNEILDMWDVDSKITEENLFDTAMGVARLHAKYIRFYIEIKQSLLTKEQELKKLKFYLNKYYLGHATQEELMVLKRPQYQYTHTKTDIKDIIKSDMLYLSKESEYKEISIMSEAITEIIASINKMSFNIKNIVEYKKYLAGVV
ncbi:MAG: recombination mediator protein UvsY [Endozoicomonadaceae bacterium]|nr:recombination mediator protein UvsY [Endozoicomonadaceae bacterium]